MPSLKICQGRLLLLHAVVVQYMISDKHLGPVSSAFYTASYISLFLVPSVCMYYLYSSESHDIKPHLFYIMHLNTCRIPQPAESILTLYSWTNIPTYTFYKIYNSTVAQWQRVGLITQRLIVRIYPVLFFSRVKFNRKKN